MRLVCLGVMWRFLLYWKGPVGPLNVWLSSRDAESISKTLMSFTMYIPCEFAHKPRSLTKILRWKATEFRQFLLYTGPVALQGILSDNFYKNFLLLFVGIKISVKALATNYCNYANDLLVSFVRECTLLFGKECMVYNVHNLIHLATDVKTLGTLNEFSCFPYENVLGIIKKLVRKPQFVLQQVFNRILEKSNIKKVESSVLIVKQPCVKKLT